MTKVARDSSNPPRGSAGIGALVRLGWMVGGTLTMLVSVMSIAARPAWRLGSLDVVFWSAVIASIILRYIDVARFAGETADGRPATRADFGYYAAGLSVIATLAWYAAQSLHL